MPRIGAKKKKKKKKKSGAGKVLCIFKESNLTNKIIITIDIYILVSDWPDFIIFRKIVNSNSYLLED